MVKIVSKLTFKDDNINVIVFRADEDAFSATHFTVTLNDGSAHEFNLKLEDAGAIIYLMFTADYKSGVFVKRAYDALKAAKVPSIFYPIVSEEE